MEPGMPEGQSLEGLGSLEDLKCGNLAPRESEDMEGSRIQGWEGLGRLGSGIWDLGPRGV